jgi:ABC-type transport system involved in cytochrome bd biosynthesis fused ATPase/permease subunit
VQIAGCIQIALTVLLEDVFGKMIHGEAGVQILWISAGVLLLNLLVRQFLEINADGKMKVGELIANLLVFQN